MLRGRAGLRGLGLVLVAGLSVLISSCSGDDPAPASSSSVVPAQTATPEPTITKPPLQLWYPTQDSAVAFIKYFIGAYNYAYATYDTSILEGISEPSCTSCSTVIAEVKRLESRKTQVFGGQIVFVTAALPHEDIADSAHIVAITSQKPRESRGSDGSVFKHQGTKNSQTLFVLDWDGGAWRTRAVQVQKPGTPWLG